jgi:hypothetical protein
MTLKLRARYTLAGALMLALWAASVVSLFHEASAVNIVLAALATVIILPLGFVALLGGIYGSEASMRRAHIALFVAGGLLGLVMIVEIVRRLIFANGA